MCIATIIITLLAVVIVLLLIHIGRASSAERDDSGPEQPSLFGDTVPGFDHDPDEFAHRIYQAFSQPKKGK